MDEKKTINFGTAPLGYPQSNNEEKIKQTVDEINKEMREAGLPWWAGLFHPKIIEAAGIGRSECKCAETNDNHGGNSMKPMFTSEEPAEMARMEREAQFNKDMDDLRKIQKERDRLLLEADKAALNAIQTALDIMKSLQEVDKDKGVVAMGAADLGRAIAALRESMNQKHYPIGHGWTA